MRSVIIIPEVIERVLTAHLFQNSLEQGAFLFVNVVETVEKLSLDVADIYVISPEGWEIQSEVSLELRDTERAKIMKKARDGGFAVIDCHSHPGSGSKVGFSPSDRAGAIEFAAYAKWKLDRKPYAAMVCGESSKDAIVWHGSFTTPRPVHEICIVGRGIRMIVPRGTWFKKQRSFLWRGAYGR